MEDFQIFDGIIGEELHREVYDWIQGASLYTKWIGIENENRTIQTINEYVPALDGKTSSKHIFGTDTAISNMVDLFRFTMYRHPIGWDDASTCYFSTPVYKLWNTINEKLLNGKGSLDEGLKEGINGLTGFKRYYKNGEDYYTKYGVPRNKVGNLFVSYINARSSDPMSNDRIGKRSGQMHRDTDPRAKPEDPYYSVLFIANKEWYPTWGADLIYYDDADTGSKHWKRGYDLGWASKVVSNVPGRIVIYKHNITHSTMAPRIDADEMSLRVAFRIKLKD
tara:strand:+ start:183 stop:1019 length:837 start_codon:yes stop_codon:yes gene_type:complete